MSIERESRSDRIRERTCGEGWASWLPNGRSQHRNRRPNLHICRREPTEFSTSFSFPAISSNIALLSVPFPPPPPLGLPAFVGVAGLFIISDDIDEADLK